MELCGMSRKELHYRAWLTSRLGTTASHSGASSADLGFPRTSEGLRVRKAQIATGLRVNHHHSNVGMSLQDKDKTGVCGVIDLHQGIFLDISGTGFRIEAQTDFSLPTGRQHPIKMGDFSASAGFHRLYF